MLKYHKLEKALMSKIFLTYNNEEIQDGYFAQLQRVIAIRAIAVKYKFPYFHSEIIDLIPTQLDSFQSELQIQNYLYNINKKYAYKSEPYDADFKKIIDILAPTIQQLFLLRIRNLLSKESILVRITIPYRIIEKNPDIYMKSIDLISNKNDNYTVDKQLIVIHARRGVAIQHVVPGEKNVRVLDDNYFLTIINQIVNEFGTTSKFDLFILTDAPENDFFYKPLTKDKNTWQQFDKYNSEYGILIQGHKFKNIIESFKGNCTIIRGGDIDKSLDIIRTAGHFIMSRSSMSYVGALLNSEGKIYYPPDFWHNPLKKWVKISTK
jgi:hypothetical protein